MKFDNTRSGGFLKCELVCFREPTHVGYIASFIALTVELQLFPTTIVFLLRVTHQFDVGWRKASRLLALLHIDIVEGQRLDWPEPPNARLKRLGFENVFLMSLGEEEVGAGLFVEKVVEVDVFAFLLGFFTF